MLKLISWNVNGIRACCEKGFRESFERLDADFFCLQETKMQAFSQVVQAGPSTSSQMAEISRPVCSCQPGLARIYFLPQVP